MQRGDPKVVWMRLTTTDEVSWTSIGQLALIQQGRAIRDCKAATQKRPQSLTCSAQLQEDAGLNPTKLRDQNGWSMLLQVCIVMPPKVKALGKAVPYEDMHKADRSLAGQFEIDQRLDIACCRTLRQLTSSLTEDSDLRAIK